MRQVKILGKNMINQVSLKLFFVLCVAQFFSAEVFAEENLETKKIGFIGSLTGIAGSYGDEALNGVRLAIDEYAGKDKIQLFVEDDTSDMKNGLSSFHKLVSVDGVSSIIAGTWWANALVKPAETRKMPLVSIETSFNKDTVLGSSYFLMQGDLRDWISVFEPLIEERGWKKGAIIHFTSGFGLTLEDAMKDVFSKTGRQLVADLEYSDINANEARLLVLKLKAADPDVLYFDGQPSNLATTLRRLHEAGMQDLPVLTNSIAEDMCKNKLLDCNKIKELYFNKRKILGKDFARNYKSKYGKEPYLNSDIAYYSTKILIEALDQVDPVKYIMETKTIIDGTEYRFDDRNVLQNVRHEVWGILEGNIKILQK